MGALHQEGEKLVPDQTCAAIHCGDPMGNEKTAKSLKKKKKKSFTVHYAVLWKTKNIPPLA